MAIAAVCQPEAARPFEYRGFRGRLVEMVGLGIEFRCEPLDVFARDALFRALEAHEEDHIIEPFDHRPLGHGI
jgi:hypothetical protein